MILIRTANFLLAILVGQYSYHIYMFLTQEMTSQILKKTHLGHRHTWNSERRGHINLDSQINPGVQWRERFHSSMNHTLTSLVSIYATLSQS